MVGRVPVTMVAGVPVVVGAPAGGSTSGGRSTNSGKGVPVREVLVGGTSKGSTSSQSSEAHR